MQFSVGAKLEDIDVGEFQNGFQIKDWTRDVTVSRSKIHDNKTAIWVRASEKKPENIMITRNRFYRNGKNIDLSSGEVKEANNTYKE